MILPQGGRSPINGVEWSSARLPPCFNVYPQASTIPPPHHVLATRLAPTAEGCLHPRAPHKISVCQLLPPFLLLPSHGVIRWQGFFAESRGQPPPAAGRCIVGELVPCSTGRLLLRAGQNDGPLAERVSRGELPQARPSSKPKLVGEDECNAPSTPSVQNEKPRSFAMG